MSKIRKKTTEELAREGGQRAGVNQPRTPISVLLDNVRSLDNVGMIFRLCELARVEHLYLGGYTGYPRKEGDERPEAVIERHTRRIEKTAVYALPWQPWSYLPDPVPKTKELKAAGYQIIALEQTDTSWPYHLAEYRLPALLVAGHEREGVRQELLHLADVGVEIPILGQGNSHNVATATGILLYHLLNDQELLP